jgi:hypothetical protein
MMKNIIICKKKLISITAAMKWNLIIIFQIKYFFTYNNKDDLKGKKFEVIQIKYGIKISDSP